MGRGRYEVRATSAAQRLILDSAPRPQPGRASKFVLRDASREITDYYMYIYSASCPCSRSRKLGAGLYPQSLVVLLNNDTYMHAQAAVPTCPLFYKSCLRAYPPRPRTLRQQLQRHVYGVKFVSQREQRIFLATRLSVLPRREICGRGIVFLKGRSKAPKTSSRAQQYLQYIYSSEYTVFRSCRLRKHVLYNGYWDCWLPPIHRSIGPCGRF